MFFSSYKNNNYLKVYVEFRCIMRVHSTRPHNAHKLNVNLVITCRYYFLVSASHTVYLVQKGIIFRYILTHKLRVPNGDVHYHLIMNSECFEFFRSEKV
jgi:hypothetical protein